MQDLLALRTFRIGRRAPPLELSPYRGGVCPESAAESSNHPVGLPRIPVFGRRACRHAGDELCRSCLLMPLRALLQPLSAGISGVGLPSGGRGSLPSLSHDIVGTPPSDFPIPLPSSFLLDSSHMDMSGASPFPDHGQTISTVEQTRVQLDSVVHTPTNKN